MKQPICAGLLLVGSLVFTANCGSDDSSGDGGNEATSNGGSGGSGGTDGGGTDGGGTDGGGTDGGGTDGGGTDGGGTDGGGTAGEGSGGVPVACPDDIEDLPLQLAEAICAKRGDCCSDDAEACMTEVTAALEGIYPELAESEEAETASLDCSAFDACALAIFEANCDDWPLQSGSLGGLPVDQPACLEFVTGSASDGDDCSYNYECIDGICRVPEGETVGTCDEFADIDDSCNNTCNPATMFCNEAEVCQARLPNGESCTKDDECQSRLCDVGGSDECVAPGPDECKYVPNGAPHCALARAPGGRNTPFEPLALMVAAGLVMGVARRRTLR